MKIIDILNMIARGEEPPKKILYKEQEYEYDESEKDYYYCDFSIYKLFDDRLITRILNDEVEILEITIHNEDLRTSKKKIEKIKGLVDISNEISDGDIGEYDIVLIDDYRIGRDNDEILHDFAYTILEIQNKINEIIERLNEDQE